MRFETALINETTIHLDEETKKLAATIKLQATLNLQEYMELIRLVEEQEDGAFTTTIEKTKK